MPTLQHNSPTRIARPTPLFAAEAQQILSAGDARQAVEVCKRGLVYFPEQVTGYIVLAQAYLTLGRSESAINVLRDGHRRTGVEQLERMRAEVAGEIVAEPEPAQEEIGQTATEQAELPVNRDRADSEEVTIGGSEVDHVNGDHIDTEQPRTEEIGTNQPDSPAVEPDQSAIGRSNLAVSDIIPALDDSILDPVPADEEIMDEGIAELTETNDETADQNELETATPQIVEEIEDEVMSGDEEIASAEEIVIEVAAPGMIEQDAIEEIIQTETSVIVNDPLVAESIARTTEEIEMAEIELLDAATGEATPADARRVEEAQPQVMEENEPPQPIAEPREVPSQAGQTKESATVVPPAMPTPEPSMPHLRPLTATATREQKPEGRTKPGSGDRLRQYSLALHTGKNVARLRSANLRLIPGLEFAPLRHEDHPRRQSIAPLMDEPMPAWDVPRRTSEREMPPPMPAFSSVENAPTAGIAVPEPLSERRAESSTTFSSVEEPAQTAKPDTIDSRETLPSASPVISFESRPAYTRDEEQPTEEERTTSEAADAQSARTPLEELARRLESARMPSIAEAPARPSMPFEPPIVSDTLANILVSQGAYAEALKAFQTLARLKPEKMDYYQQRILEMKWRLQHPGEPWVSEE